MDVFFSFPVTFLLFAYFSLKVLKYILYYL